MIPKKHTEFHTIDITSGWHTPPGYPSGIQRKILSGELDEENMSGSRTQLLRLLPGAYSSAPFVHDYWEEVYVIDGVLTVGGDEEGAGGVAYPAHTFACRPPGIVHGPFRSDIGCLLLEIHYYES